MTRPRHLIAVGCVLLGLFLFLLSDGATDSERQSEQPASNADTPQRPLLLTRAGDPSDEDAQAPTGEETTRVEPAAGGLPSITWRFVDGDGKPVAGAVVEIGPWRATSVWGDTTSGVRHVADVRGLIHLDRGDAEGLVWVVATSPAGHLATTARHVVAPTDRQRFVLLAANAARGRVITHDGMPLPGGTYVEAMSDDWPSWPGRRRFPVGPDGAFLVPGLQQGGVVLTARAPGHLGAPAVIWDGPGTDDAGIELVLGPPTVREIQIRVVASDGEPVEEGTPILVAVDQEDLRVVAVEADGQLRVSAPASVERLRCDVRGLRLEDGTWWSLPSSETFTNFEEPLVYRIQTACNLRFTLTTVQGTPVADAALTLRGTSEETSAISIPVRSDAGGRIVAGAIVPLPAGTYALQFPGRPPLWQGRVESGRTPTRAGVSLREYSPLTVQVRDAQGRPVRHTGFVALRCRPANAADRADWIVAGQVALGAASECNLWVDAACLLPQREPRLTFSTRARSWLIDLPLHQVVRNERGYVLDLPPERFGSVRGRVLLPSGVPVRGAAVWLDREGHPAVSLTTNAEGHFGHPWVEVGTYRLQVRVGADAPIQESALEIRPGTEATPDVTWELRPR